MSGLLRVSKSAELRGKLKKSRRGEEERDGSVSPASSGGGRSDDEAPGGLRSNSSEGSLNASRSNSESSARKRMSGFLKSKLSRTTSDSTRADGGVIGGGSSTDDGSSPSDDEQQQTKRRSRGRTGSIFQRHASDSGVGSGDEGTPTRRSRSSTVSKLFSKQPTTQYKFLYPREMAMKLISVKTEDSVAAVQKAVCKKFNVSASRDRAQMALFIPREACPRELQPPSTTDEEAAAEQGDSDPMDDIVQLEGSRGWSEYSLSEHITIVLDVSQSSPQSLLEQESPQQKLAMLPYQRRTPTQHERLQNALRDERLFLKEELENIVDKYGDDSNEADSVRKLLAVLAEADSTKNFEVVA